MTSRSDRYPVRVGIALWSQAYTWPELREAAHLAEELGLDSLWAGDHLLPFAGDPDQDVFEVWTVMAAWAAITRRITIGLHVGSNTFRNPGLVAKSAVTVDHISGGRTWLGMGGGWFEREHIAYGLGFGSGHGERLDWLEESVAAISRLLEGGSVTSTATGHYGFVGLRQRPLPVGGPGALPIMIGGSGEKKTLRTVARHARGWNTQVDLETAKRKLDVLDRHCADAGRDIAEIEFTLSAPCILRDDPAEARRVHRDVMVRQAGGYEGPPGLDLFGPEERIAELWGPFVELGFRHLIPGMPAPLEQETLERLPGVRDIVAGASG